MIPRNREIASTLQMYTSSSDKPRTRRRLPLVVQLGRRQVPTNAGDVLAARYPWSSRKF
jgi:hypothetical protein